jgi:hypothetical protein
MNKKQNPKLQVGDRIILIYMPGEDIDTGTKGKVIKIGDQPNSVSDFNYMYLMEWYDDNGNVSDSLSLLPQSDTWILDPEFSSKNIHEARFTELDDLIKHHEWSKLFKKSDLKYVIDYLKVIRDLGVVNMMEAGQFLGQTKEYLTKYFDLHRMQRELDDEDEELIECNSESAAKKYADELASGELIIDPLTGKAIPNPNAPAVEPAPSATPVP